ncbi:unnamed protein product [Rotaria magnacalcarata]
MIRKFRKIFRTPSSVTANKNENSHKATTADSNPCDILHVKQGSSAVSNHVHKVPLRLYIKVNVFLYVGGFFLYFFLKLFFTILYIERLFSL